MCVCVCVCVGGGGGIYADALPLSTQLHIDGKTGPNQSHIHIMQWQL